MHNSQNFEDYMVQNSVYKNVQWKNLIKDTLIRRKSILFWESRWRRESLEIAIANKHFAAMIYRKNGGN